VYCCVKRGPGGGREPGALGLREFHADSINRNRMITTSSSPSLQIGDHLGERAAGTAASAAMQLVYREAWVETFRWQSPWPEIANHVARLITDFGARSGLL
jgi:hypothetical protein